MTCMESAYHYQMIILKGESSGERNFQKFEKSKPVQFSELTFTNLPTREALHFIKNTTKRSEEYYQSLIIWTFDYISLES